MISGSTICLNAVRRDYCLEACIRSMLGVCDEVVVVDGGSDDGTVELVEGIDDKRVRLFHIRVNPSGGWKWLRDWSESARQKCRFDMHLYVQADEVLHERGYVDIFKRSKRRSTALVRRYNFWFDENHILPGGHGVCSDNVIRLAPTSVNFHPDSDAESLNGQGAEQSEIALFHYGFIRRQEAFVEKCYLMSDAYGRSRDPIVAEVEKRGIEALLERYPLGALIPFFGSHPIHAQPWLQKRKNLETSLSPI